MKNLVSIIVPIYNCEPYLHKCIDSLINQTYENLEIILINDGSTDNSLKIAQAYANKDKRIHLINQNKSGVSTSRNQGLDVARGEFISFIDADDWIDTTTVEDNIGLMITHNADIITYNNYVVDKAGTTPHLINTEEDTLEGYIQKLALGLHTTYMVTNKIFRSNILQGVKFPNKTIGEDLLFLLEVLKKKPILIGNSKSYYYYNRLNVQSATHVNNLSNHMHFLDLNKSVLAYIRKYYPQYFSQQLNNYAQMIFKIVYRFQMRKLLNKEENAIILSGYDYLIRNFSNLSTKNKINCYLYRYFPFYFKVKSIPYYFKTRL